MFVMGTIKPRFGLNLSDQGTKRLEERKHEVGSCVRQLQNSFTRKFFLQIKKSEKLHLMYCEKLLSVHFS